MKINKLTVNWLFFLLSLGFALFYANRGDKRSNNLISLKNIEYSEFKSLTYKTKRYQIKIYERNKKDYWAKYERFESLQEPKGRDDKVSRDSSQASESPKVIESSLFKLSPDVDALIQNWANLRVEKNIGKLDQLDLGKFGLSNSNDFITIADAKGTTSSFVIGEQSFKSPFQFVKDVKHNDVLLISKDFIDALVSSRSKFLKALLFSEDDLDMIRVERSGIVTELKAEMKKSKQDGQDEKIWLNQGRESNKSVDVWVKKLIALRVEEYEDVDLNASSNEDDFLMLLETFSNGKKLDSLRLHRKKTKDSHEYWISSTRDRFLAKLVTARIDSLLSDFESNFKN